MTPELIAILAVGVALAGLILQGHRSVAQRLDRLEQRFAQLEQRVARLEGLFEGFTRGRPEAAE